MPKNYTQFCIECCLLLLFSYTFKVIIKENCEWEGLLFVGRWPVNQLPAFIMGALAGLQVACYLWVVYVYAIMYLILATYFLKIFTYLFIYPSVYLIV